MPKRKASETSSVQISEPEEPEVRDDEPMPKGYKFVPKGDVYITKHCRKKTHEAGKTLYVVVDGKNKPIGLRCPAHIFRQVISQNEATATQRAEAVQKRDAAIQEDFGEAIVKLFPKIPRAEVPLILKHSLKKHSRRVGRTGTVELHERVRLAVRAHIRHVHTDYDKKLRQGVSREEARAQIWERLNNIAKEWGGRPARPGEQAAPSPAKKARSSGTAKKAVVRMALRSRIPTCHLVGAGSVNGSVGYVDVVGDVFPMDEDMSEYDSDYRE
ncbi:hypothetical protein VTK26DRAFT_4302 [Humicola hyalothermophila]